MEQRETECCTPNGQIKRYKDCIGCDKKPLELNQNKMSNQTKKETIEEVAIKKYGTGYHAVNIKHAFIDGAKWMEEQMEKEQSLKMPTYNLDELYEKVVNSDFSDKYEDGVHYYSFIEGFQKALELLTFKSE